MFAGRLQVLDMADMKQVENPVAMNHLLAPLPGGLNVPGQVVERLDFVGRVFHFVSEA
jgi:hypothetical protein